MFVVSMKRHHRPLPHFDWLATVVLLLLVLLASLLWSVDPAHQASGGSRIDWPVRSSRP